MLDSGRICSPFGRRPGDGYAGHTTKTHHWGKLHTAFNTGALEHSVEALAQSLDTRDRLVGLQALPAGLCDFQRLEAGHSGSPRQGVGAARPAHLGRKVKLGLLNVDSHDRCAAGRSGKRTGQETDSAGTEDENPRTGLETCSSERVQNDRQRFSKRSDVERYRVR